jgi:hypothetical protein
VDADRGGNLKTNKVQLSITMGSVDEDSVKGGLQSKVDYHIFVGPESKAEWYDIPEDGKPRYAKFDPGFQKRIDECK